MWNLFRVLLLSIALFATGSDAALRKKKKRQATLTAHDEDASHAEAVKLAGRLNILKGQEVLNQRLMTEDEILYIAGNAANKAEAEGSEDGRPDAPPVRCRRWLLFVSVVLHSFLVWSSHFLSRIHHNCLCHQTKWTGSNLLV